MSETWHRDFIAALTFALRPDFYLELGCGSLGTISKVTAKRRVGVDIAPYKSADPTIEIFTGSTDEYFSFFYSNEIEKLLPLGDTKGCSVRGIDVLGVFYPPQPIDILFIDADHSQESVKKDFNNFFPYVKKNGLVLLHDTYPADKLATNPGRCGTAWQAVIQIKQNPCEVLTIPLHPGLTIVRKGTAQIPW